MNDHTDTNAPRLWAYVHGELPEAERREFEQQLARDPSLRRQVEATSRLDGRLRTVFAVVDADENAWADRALAAWDREVAGSVAQGVGDASCGRGKAGAAPAAPAGGPRPATPPAVWERRILWPALVGLAAAASLLLLFLPQAPSPSILWNRPEFVPLVTRGAPPAAHLTPAIADACTTALRKAVERAQIAQALMPRPGLSIQVRLQELPAGAFAVIVQARRQDGAVEQEWCGDYSSYDLFLQQLPASADLIAGSLAVPPTLPAPPKP